MDNLTHSLAGWALGQAGLKTQTRKGLAALILAANMPDIDIFFGWVPWAPLAIHRGFTHGLVGGIIVMPPILFGLLLLLDRWQVGRGAIFRSGLSLQPHHLLGLCYLGAVTHPLLDLLTTYSVQLLSPLSNAWYHADGLFIIDLVLWLVLGGSIIWSKRREKQGCEWRKPVQAAIGIALAYIAFNLFITNRAVAVVRSDSPQAASIFASPEPFFFWKRSLVWQEGDCYRRRAYDPVAGAGPVTECEPTGMNDPLVRQAIRDRPYLRNFLRWSVMPFATVERARCSVEVTIGDARYGDVAHGSRIARQAVVPTGAPGC